MARRCVCKICKKEGNTDIFYKVNENGKNKYYCSKEEFDNYINNKNKREELLKFIAEDVLELDEGQIINPIMIRKLTDLNNFYDYEVIHNCFKGNKDTIQYWMKNKKFKNEYGMISYIMKIIEGSINDFYDKWKHENKQKVAQEREMIDINIINQLNVANQCKKPSTNGILDFLDEEDI